jgi:PadR family transcriptional regulator, regulatory protein PadR
MKRTKPLIKIAAVMMSNPDGKQWGYDLWRQSGVRSGVMYPILRRMLEDGWLEDGWEDPATTIGRPPRRYYTITTFGAGQLEQLAALADVA